MGTNPQAHTYVQIGYETFQVNVKDVSPLLAILGSATKVDRRYVGDDTFWVVKPPERYERLTVTQDTTPVISDAEYDTRKEAHDEARERASVERPE